MPQQQPPDSAPPVDYVLSMQKQGLSNSQIMEFLQRQGYNSDQIFAAMNQATLKSGVEDPSGNYFEGPQNGDQDQMQDEGINPMMGQGQGNPQPDDPNMGYNQQQNFQQPMAQQPNFAPNMGGQGSGPNEQIEMIAEAIIDEKWKELTNHINKIIEWKEHTESKIDHMEQEMADMKKNFDTLHGAILGKVNEYDKNMVDLGVEIKAMEKVFQKVLPTLTESVGELSKISEDMKQRFK